MRFIIAAVCFSLIGCVPIPTQPVTTRNSELTHGNVQMNLRVDTTIQAEVLETFGAPNITTIDGAGREVWTYQRNATVAQSSAGSNYWTIVLAGGGTRTAGFEQTSRTITLIIKFDKNKMVSDFHSRASNF